MIQAFAFYLFATLVIASAMLVILARNPVHSVLWLILAFFNAAGLMLILGAEFIAMLLVIVYVGAVSAPGPIAPAFHAPKAMMISVSSTTAISVPSGR